MELLKTIRSGNTESEHWVAIEQGRTPPELRSLDDFRQKLVRTLNELGKVDYSLQESLTSLRAEVNDTHDRLRAQVTEIAEPDVNKAMAELANSITRTMDLVDGVLADTRMRKQ
jgi:hypothetical protein